MKKVPSPSAGADWPDVGENEMKNNASEGSDKPKIGVLRLAALLFFSVSGGPLGTEGLVNAAGPLYSLIGLCILPLIWCFPVGLMTAELSSAFPKDGGYVWWVDAAFGRFWGFMMGWISWSGGVVDTAIYPGMFLSFVVKTFNLQLSAVAKQCVLVAFNVALTCINLLGVGVAGTASVVFCAVVLMPVALLVAVSLPLNPGAWTAVPAEVNWVRWINIALWNTNGFDSVSTIGGEVSKPMHTYPWAILVAGFAIIVPYLLCIMAATSDDQSYEDYENGTYNLIAKRQGGWMLGFLFTIGTSAAAAGMYMSDMTTYSYQLSGMAEEGLVPAFFSYKLPRLETPLVAISLQLVVVMAMSDLDFHEILACDNLLYCLGLMLELCAMVSLRSTQPNLSRPFRIPMNTTGVAFLMCGPAFFCVYIFYTSTLRAVLTSSGVVAAGVLLWFVMPYVSNLGVQGVNTRQPFHEASKSNYNAL